MTNMDELRGDPRRQAVASIRGTVYQAWCSIDAWLRLANAEEVIYLEGAEDFDVVGGADGDIAVQVKRHEGSISLGNAKAHEALEHYWALAARNPTRTVFVHYLTTSAAAMERDASFGGLCGIDAWRAALTNASLAQAVARYLASKLESSSALRQFLVTAMPADLQVRLFARFMWFTDQPDIDAVQRSVEDRVSVLLASQRRALSLVSSVRAQLESRFWEVITTQDSALRCLTLGDLLRQVESASTAYLPLPVEQIPELLAVAPPGMGLLKLLLQKAPRAPTPLLPRPGLTERVRVAVDARRVVLLTGTVYKGKTTIAQQVVASHFPDAWWVNLTDRRADQVDNVLLALGSEIDRGSCPGLVVIDDLDISPLAHRTYKGSLSLLLHRTRAMGQGVILTAQGGSSDSAQLSEFGRLDVIEVPELGLDEVKALCILEGCEAEDADAWAVSVFTFTRGHPKLVQVSLMELSARGWPRPAMSDFLAPSEATQSARQLARRLLSQSVPPLVAEFLYCVSESSVLLHRTVALRLAEALGLQNGGDVLDTLTGKWIERIERDWHRTTPLLQGAARDVWSNERRQRAHIQLHDAILSKQTLIPSEGAGLLYHAFLGRDWSRVARDALQLQLVNNEDATREVERHLLWLPFVALEPGQLIADTAGPGVALRSLQFRVAVTLDSDNIPRICDRWAEELSQLSDPLVAEGMSALMWSAIAISESPKIPLRNRLTAIQGLATLTGKVAQVALEGTQAFLKNNGGHAGIPTNGSQTQLMLALTSRWIRSADALGELVSWLDADATDELRTEFDSILEWPLVQTMGAFVQSAWAANHENTSEWNPWLELFDRIEGYAERRGSQRFGREAAKGKSIILSEFVNDREGALSAIDVAEQRFGRSSVLDEQRANVLFQREDDERVLEIWAGLVKNADAHAVVDPFAYRRAAISASRLGRRADSIATFRAGANCVEPEGFALTRFGLLVDCALVELQDSRLREAARTLSGAILDLPMAAGEEGDERWEPVQRAAVEVCRCIENTLWRPLDATARIDVGYASSPARKVEKTEPGQAGRTLLLRAQGARLAATHGLEFPRLQGELEFLGKVPYRAVRWTATEGTLARVLACGAGADFMQALVDFDLATSKMEEARGGGSIVLPDDAGVLTAEPHAERWFGVLVAGAWCAGAAIDVNFNRWLEWLGTRSEHLRLRVLVEQLRSGFDSPQDDLLSVVRDGSRTPAMRCGAALKLLRGPIAIAERLQLQGLLTSALVSDASFARQDVFNLHVARHVAAEWKVIGENSFQFQSPRHDVPVLMRAVELVEQGRGTLKVMLSSINIAVHARAPEYMSRVW